MELDSRLHIEIYNLLMLIINIVILFGVTIAVYLYFSLE